MKSCEIVIRCFRMNRLQQLLHPVHPPNALMAAESLRLCVNACASWAAPQKFQVTPGGCEKPLEIQNPVKFWYHIVSPRNQEVYSRQLVAIDFEHF